MAHDTVGTVINDAAVELGLLSYSGKLDDPLGSPDANIGQLAQMLKSIGSDLVARYQWSDLISTYAFNTTLNVAGYVLPVDYARFVDQTAWNRTTRLPSAPLSSQQYAYLESRLGGAVFNVLFRVIKGQFVAYPDINTPGNLVIAYEYVSSSVFKPLYIQSGPFVGNGQVPQPASTRWSPQTTYNEGAFVTHGGSIYLTSAGGVSGTFGPIGTGTDPIPDGSCSWVYYCPYGMSVPVNSGDSIRIESNLVSRALILGWLRKQGFDSGAAADDFDRALEQAKNADTVAPVLSLGGGSVGGGLLGDRNIPYTGWGL